MAVDNNYSDSEIIQLIKNGGSAFEQIAEYLFESHLGYIHKAKKQLNLSLEQANDAYADALVKLIRQIRNDRFLGESKLSTYFYSIFHNTCVDVLRKETTNLSYSSLNELAYSKKEKDLLNLIELKDSVKQVKAQMHQIGEPCKKILLDWAYWGYSMREIAVRSSLASEESARSMKYKCLKKLKAIMTTSNGYT